MAAERLDFWLAPLAAGRRSRDSADGIEQHRSGTEQPQPMLMTNHVSTSAEEDQRDNSSHKPNNPLMGWIAALCCRAQMGDSGQMIPCAAPTVT